MRNKALIIGYGSIGRRHNKVLETLNTDVAFVRSGKSKLAESSNLLAGSVFFDLDEAIDSFKPLYVVDCSPSSFHLTNLLKTYRRKIHGLIEKPLILDNRNEEELKELETIAEDPVLKYGLSYQYRFHPIINEIKIILDKLSDRKVLFGNIIWTEYLPNWHPWEDFKTSYASSKSLYGGCFFTMCHPFDYVNYLFKDSEFEMVHLSKGRLNIEVNQSARLKCNSKSIFYDLDIFVDFDSKINRHNIFLEGKDWTLNADLFKNEISFISGSENFKRNFGKINRNSLFKSLHIEFQKWLMGDGSFRSKLSDNLNLIEFMSKYNKNN